MATNNRHHLTAAHSDLGKVEGGREREGERRRKGGREREKEKGREGAMQ